jgi:DNA repair protein RadB
MSERKISTGSFDLNKWLYGGYEKEIITAIAGVAGSGKTNFCMLAAVSQAKKGMKVIFVDSEGGFSVDRVRQLAKEDYEKVLENILILKPMSFEEQKKDFLSLLKMLKDNKNVGLIVVDGMTMLYRLELGDAAQEKDDARIKDVNRELAGQMRALAEISRRRNIPVLVTNQVYGSFLTDEERTKGVKPEMNMVGGDLLKYWSKCIIHLEFERGRRRAVLVKHRSLPMKSLGFKITNDNIRKAGWI